MSEEHQDVVRAPGRLHRLLGSLRVDHRSSRPRLQLPTLLLEASRNRPRGVPYAHSLSISASMTTTIALAVLSSSRSISSSRTRVSPGAPRSRRSSQPARSPEGGGRGEARPRHKRQRLEALPSCPLHVLERHAEDATPQSRRGLRAFTHPGSRRLSSKRLFQLKSVHGYGRRVARRIRCASMARCLGPPTFRAPSPAETSSGPRIRNSMAAEPYAEFRRKGRWLC